MERRFGGLLDHLYNHGDEASVTIEMAWWTARLSRREDEAIVTVEMSWWTARPSVAMETKSVSL